MKKTIIGLIVTILILTVLQFPAPVGFESRPQADVSLFWLAFFLIILIVEISIISVIYKWPILGAKLGILGGVLNIMQVVADQAHLMQPEAASFGYSMLEYTVAMISVVLIYFSWKVLCYNKNLNN